MAGIRHLSTDISMGTLWEELVFTWARLQARPITREHAKVFEELIGRVGGVEEGQRSHWKTETLADAAVGVADEDLDDVTDEIVAEVRHADRKSGAAARETLYLGTLTLGALIRLGLGSQLKRVRGWVASLASEPEESLKKLGKRIGKVVISGDEALEQRVSAAAGRATHRAREITSLVDDVNAARRDTYGSLIQLGTKAGRPKDWPERFFRRGAGSKARKATTPPDEEPTG